MSYVIGIKGSDTCFEVNYDPEDGSIELERLDIVQTQDLSYLFVAVPVGALGAKMVPLKEYLEQRAKELYQKDDLAQEDYRNGLIEAAAEARRGE